MKIVESKISMQIISILLAIIFTLTFAIVLDEKSDKDGKIDTKKETVISEIKDLTPLNIEDESDKHEEVDSNGE